MANFKKPLAAALGAAFMASSVVPLASAESNPFSAQQLSGGYDLPNYAAHKEGGCGEGKCGSDNGDGGMGDDGAHDEGMGDDGAHDEGMDDEGAHGEDKSEGEGKCGEGKCGGDGADAKSEGEGKCGEGKCGG